MSGANPLWINIKTYVMKKNHFLNNNKKRQEEQCCFTFLFLQIPSELALTPVGIPTVFSDTQIPFVTCGLRYNL